MEKQDISFEELSTKILSDILFYTLPEDTPSIRLTSKKFKAAITNNFFWENKFKLHFPHYYQQSKQKDNPQWYNEFFSEYIVQYQGLSANIQRLFSIAKEGSVKLLEDYIAQNSSENEWVQHIAMVDITGISVLEWIRINHHQPLLDCIYENIIKINADKLLTINEEIKLSPQSTLWFVLCRQPEDKLNALVNVDDAWISGYQAIHFAVENGNIEIIEKLLAHGVYIMTDCGSKCEKFIQSLKNQGEFNYSKHLNLTTPFKIALKNRQIEVAKFILKHINIDITYEYNNTLLHMAVLSNCVEIVEELLKNKADVNAINSEGLTPLHMAVRFGLLSIIEKLLKFKANINANTAPDGTPFYFALFSSPKSIEILLNEKPNIYAFTKHGDSILHMPAHQRNSNIQMLEKLLSMYGEKIRVMVHRENSDGLTPLHLAAHNGNYNMVSFLIKIGADVNFVTPREVGRQTPLFYAVFQNHLEVIDLLIANKADIDAVNVQGQTVLHCILEILFREQLLDEQRIKVIEKLIIEYKANVNIADFYGLTPLYIAVEGNSTFIVEILLKNSAKINFVQSFIMYLEQKPLLHIAILNGNIDIFTLLLKYSRETVAHNNEAAYVDSVDKFGRTALHLAVEKGLSAFVKILLEYKASIDIRDKQGDKPIDIAQRKVDTDIVHLINIQSLNNYLKELSQRPDSHRYGLFGCTAGEKRKAAEALKRVVCDNENSKCLESHKKALSEGRLKKIYDSLYPVIETFFLDENTSIEMIKINAKF